MRWFLCRYGVTPKLWEHLRVAACARRISWIAREQARDTFALLGIYSVKLGTTATAKCNGLYQRLASFVPVSFIARLIVGP